MRLFGTMEVRDNNLYIGGVSCKNLKDEYGTPLYVIDEEFLRGRCKEYYNNFGVEKYGNKVAYAGKAFLTIAMCQIIKEEGLFLDVVSSGELYTALKANFPMNKIYFHGNNKTLDEIEMGIELGVGRFVVDNFYEMNNINEMAGKKGIKQSILLRITPGIEAHTHDYIKTGQVDSKFGFSMVNQEVYKAVEKAINLPNINLSGIHCHIGSQIFETTPYEEAVDVMFEILREIKDKYDYEINEVDLGGGFGIYYTKEDKPKETKEYCEAILKRAINKSKELGIKLPMLGIEPGRSIIGNAATLIYTIGAIKDIPGVRKYASIDGGMNDNIRPALYEAKYECEIANNMNSEERELVTIAGKCCETGDIVIKDAYISKCKSGDILAIPSVGAYGYSMASNYNKITKPAVVLVKNGRTKLMCKRESFDDMLKNELNL